MPKRKYRIGLIVEGSEVRKWVRDIADWARTHPTIELAAIVCEPRRSGLLDRLFEVESRFLCRGSGYRAYAGRQSVGDCAPVVDVRDSGQLAGFQLDALVSCGRHLPAALADAARDGIISVEADGFGEIVAGRPDTPFAIMRFAGGARQVLFSGSVATALLYAWNVISLQARSFQYLKVTLERLASGRIEPVAETDPKSRASAGGLLTYAARTAQRSLGKALRRLLGQEFNWQVAVCRNAWSDCRFDEATVVASPPNAFLADPFTIEVDGRTYLFVEEFPYDTRKGVISAYRLDGGQPERIGVVLAEPHHLSFPFLFEHKGEIYMVPEGGGGRSVKLYRASSFPTGWTEVKTLLPDVPAVDTIMFEHDSRWWMLTTIQGEGPGLNNAELHAFHADSPLCEWTAHEANPIVMDAGKGRNGGFVRDADGRPCRVAQVPGFTFYGAGSAVYRIDELTPAAYRETLVKQIEPNFFPGLDGTHHVHCTGGMTAFDFMRVERPRGSGRGRLASLISRTMDAPRGFEPRLTESESVVLPLDDGAAWEAAR